MYRFWGENPMRRWAIGLPALSLMLALPVQAQSVVCPPQPLPPEPKSKVQPSPMPSPVPRLKPPLQQAIVSRLILRLEAIKAYENEKFSESEDRFNRFLHEAPQDTQAWSTLGHVLRRQGKIEAAKQAYDRALQASQRNLEAYMGRAIIERPDAKDIDLSQGLDAVLRIDRHIYINVHQKFLQKNPDYEPAYELVEFALLKDLRQKVPNWPDILTSSRKQNELNSYNLNVNAAQTFRPEQIQPLVELYRQAYQRFSDNPKFFNLWIEMLQIQGKYLEAIQGYQDAIEQNPRSLDLYIGLGHALTRAKRLEEAQQTFCQALQVSKLLQLPILIYPGETDLSDALEGLAKVLNLKKQPLAIIPLYQQELEHKNLRSMSDLRYSFIKVLTYLQQWEKLVPIYQPLITKTPNDYDLYIGLSKVYEKLGKVPDGILTIQSGLKVVANTNDYWKTRLENQLDELSNPKASQKQR
jgi:tetratricopeptide (TPR) repeat protein